ncbi:cyclin domain protein [Necator americanus]|uniref:Cyclin domain protein n=1 Tax=Necator americanus TaxID=51031 RepID=W2T4M5_NECAM|nr:cyclin domain protein [Necator americanus]ETN76529.1 cyclin domain protein [Necator americanus]
MKGRRRRPSQKSRDKAEEAGGIAPEKLERESTTTQTQQTLPQRTPSTSSTASRKRKTESAEASTSSVPCAKRRQTSDSLEEMAPEFLPSTSEEGCQPNIEDDQLSVFSTEASSEHAPSFSDSECEEQCYDEYNEELENDAFRELEAGLNDYTYHVKDTPPQLTALRCTGIGSPKKVWGLLCRKNELIRASHRLLDNHPELVPRTRAVLVDWMMEVCGSEKQHRETFHLAVDYVDRFLGTFHGIRSQTFQLVGTAALFLASKYEEIYPPKLEEFVAYTDGACTEHDVRTFEIIMLKELHWSLSPITSVHWLSMYMQFLGNKEEVKNDGEKHVVDQSFIVPDTLREDFMNMAKVLDLVLLDVVSLKYSYRELAAAVLFACYEPHSLVQEVTGYSYADLLKVVEWVEPVVKVCERLRSLGDPILIVEGVRADDLHNIQTHPDQDFEEIMANIESEREIADRARQKLPIARRRGPLRTRCTNPDHITIFT